MAQKKTAKSARAQRMLALAAQLKRVGEGLDRLETATLDRVKTLADTVETFNAALAANNADADAADDTQH